MFKVQTVENYFFPRKTKLYNIVGWASYFFLVLSTMIVTSLRASGIIIFFVLVILSLGCPSMYIHLCPYVRVQAYFQKVELSKLNKEFRNAKAKKSLVLPDSIQRLPSSSHNMPNTIKFYHVTLGIISKVPIPWHLFASISS